MIAIEGNHPELVAAIRGLRTTGKAERAALKEARSVLREQARTARKEAKTLARHRASARESATIPRPGEARITSAQGFDQPAFSGQFFDEDTAKRITKQLGLAEKGQFERLAETTGSVGDVMRVMRAGFDFGAPLLQGLPLLATDPAKWARGVKHQFIAFAQPQNHQRYISENLQAVDEMLGRGVPLSGAASDYHDAIRKGAFLDKQLARGGVPGRAVGGTLQRFQRSFDSYGDFARIEQWKALRGTAATKGEAGLDDLAVYLRNSTGALSPASIGINPSQQAFERGFLFFSPRYTRASLALVTNAFQGGVRGELARRAFRNMAMGGLGTYMLASAALGQEPKLDPAKGDFMTVKIAGDRVGVGSFWNSFVRLIGNTVSTAGSDPENLFSRSSRDNPLLRWVRGRSAPPTGAIWDITTGHDFLGNDVEGNVVDWAKHIGKGSLPFAVEAATIQKPSRAGPVALGAEIFGARTFPLRLSVRRNILRDQRAQARFGKTWEELNRLQRDQITNDEKEVELRDLTERAGKDWVARGDQTIELVDEFYTQRDIVKDTWKETIERGYANVDAGVIDLKRFRQDVLTNANAQRRAGFLAINENDRYAPVQEWLKERVGPEEKPEDIAYDEYVTDVITNTDLNLPEGFDYRAQETIINEFRVKYGDEIYGYVRERLDEGRETHPILDEFYKGRERFKFYWRDTVDRVIESRADASEVRVLYERWERATQNEQRELREQFPNLNATIGTIGRVRSALREKNQELDAFLFRWGYTDTIRHESNQFDAARDIIRSPQPRLAYVL